MAQVLRGADVTCQLTVRCMLGMCYVHYGVHLMISCEPINSSSLGNTVVTDVLPVVGADVLMLLGNIVNKVQILLNRISR